MPTANKKLSALFTPFDYRMQAYAENRPVESIRAEAESQSATPIDLSVAANQTWDNLFPMGVTGDAASYALLKDGEEQIKLSAGQKQVLARTAFQAAELPDNPTKSQRVEHRAIAQMLATEMLVDMRRGKIAPPPESGVWTAQVERIFDAYETDRSGALSRFFGLSEPKPQIDRDEFRYAQGGNNSSGFKSMLDARMLGSRRFEVVSPNNVYAGSTHWGTALWNNASDFTPAGQKNRARQLNDAVLEALCKVLPQRSADKDTIAAIRSLSMFDAKKVTPLLLDMIKGDDDKSIAAAGTLGMLVLGHEMDDPESILKNPDFIRNQKARMRDSVSQKGRNKLSQWGYTEQQCADLMMVDPHTYPAEIKLYRTAISGQLNTEHYLMNQVMRDEDDSVRWAEERLSNPLFDTFVDVAGEFGIVRGARQNKHLSNKMKLQDKLFHELKGAQTAATPDAVRAVITEAIGEPASLEFQELARAYGQKSESIDGPQLSDRAIALWGRYNRAAKKDPSLAKAQGLKDFVANQWGEIADAKSWGQDYVPMDSGASQLGHEFP